MVNHLMEERRVIFMKSTIEIARLAKESMSEGGSSYCNLFRILIPCGFSLIIVS